ncbi:hypothetical protein POVCU1_032840 [Plasmodium ovale curtisi]|uniref:Uncharacterized protein n=1 Tax=Plasmodium ovale curtisi TaxID=864141 RepID=A0A1A8WUB8_PLAOA|nr:hypothetical protein POVCU1_032840 [Plasmodium ovale curtisi]
MEWVIASVFPCSGRYITEDACKVVRERKKTNYKNRLILIILPLFLRKYCNANICIEFQTYLYPPSSNKESTLLPFCKCSRIGIQT